MGSVSLKQKQICVTMRKHGSQLCKRIKKERHIKEESEDQRRLWESRKVENKRKASFVRESGYFLCSGTGLTNQEQV